MGDQWLREPDGGWVSSPQQQAIYDMTINQLMVPNTKQWDVEKVRNLFTAQDAGKILAVPIVAGIDHDRIIWTGENNGIYSVRSGYKRGMMGKRQALTLGEREAWSRLWKIQAPPKTKHLLWRLCKGCLPTRTRLLNRFVPCTTECPVCNMDVEDEWHLFLACNGARAAWTVAGLDHLLPRSAYNNNDICAFIFELCRRNSVQTMGRVAVLLWCIWHNRNDEVWNHSKIDARQIGYQAMHMWTEWATVNGLLHDQQIAGPLTAPTTEQQQWQKPPLGVFKCNVDASFFSAEMASGWGWCVRDHDGGFILAGTEVTYTQFNTVEGEVMALMKAMQHLIQRGYTHVIFESDSKLVVDAIHSNSAGVSEFSMLISQVQSMLVSRPNFEVKFIRRQANTVAHLLARAAYSIASCQVFDFIPPCIATQLLNEMN